MPSSSRLAKKRQHSEDGRAVQNKTIRSYFGSRNQVVDTTTTPVLTTVRAIASQPNTTATDTDETGSNETVTDSNKTVPNNIINKPASKSKHLMGKQAVLSLNFEWLLVKEEHCTETGGEITVVYCKLCKKHNVFSTKGSKIWVTEGFKSLRKDRVKDHSVSEQHRHAMRLEAQLEFNRQRDVESEEDTSVACKLMDIVFYIAKNNLPLDKFASLVNLCIKTGSSQLLCVRQSCNASYTSPEAVHELLQVLAETTEGHILSQLKKSPTYSLMLDEVCDSAVHKNMGVVAKYIDSSGEPVMHFLGVCQMTRSTGEDIKVTTLQLLENKQLDPKLCTNLTSDGASSFSGKHKGAAALLSDSMPFAISIHCHDHRLALACRDAFKSVGDLDSVSEGLDSLYKFYKYSSVSSATLRELQDIHGQAHWRIQQAKHHRWLSYDKAVSCVLRGLNVVRQDLENTSNLQNKDQFTKKHAVDASALLNWITTEKTLRVLALLGDVLPSLAELSLLFQRKSVDLTYIQPKLESTLAVLESRKTTRGKWEKKLFDNTAADDDKPLITKYGCSVDHFHEKIKLPLLNSLILNLKNRFQNLNIISSLCALSLPLDVLEELPPLYRDADLRILANSFKLDEDELLVEWISWIEFLKGIDHSDSSVLGHHNQLTVLGKLLLKQQSELTSTYPHLSYLYSVAMTLCLSSAEVERLFSHLKIVKSDRRSSLSNKTLNWILQVKLNCDQQHEEKLKTAAAKTWIKNKRRRFGRYVCL